MLIALKSQGDSYAATDRQTVSDITETPEQDQEYKSFTETILDRADADGYIVLAMSDEAFTDMAINFYEASFRRHHIDNFLFIGVGRKTCETLSQQSIPCFYYADDPNAGNSSSWGEEDFKRKMNIRTDMIRQALSANVTLIHSDVDVAFLSNPLNELKVGVSKTFLVYSFIN